ncbi:hypothetical protein C4D60_Mb05t08530 [Musa balbisiana]|uniref:Uncharacterized protein n=1 Tax=Musa balbisiana TaxID=52838 RepID=A0A4S8JUP1_MUSBA|nr:hypothetical protein C4D60_Mb05t08530 [Musa balbisiana]
MAVFTYYVSDIAFVSDTMQLLGTRLVSILPNRIIQPLAEHSEYPIERIAFSNDRKFLGSISHDQMFKVRSSHSI